MKNVTLSIEEETLQAGREYARRQGTTLNAMIRDWLRRTVMPDENASARELARVMEEFTGDSGGWKWNRRELHER